MTLRDELTSIHDSSAGPEVVSQIADAIEQAGNKALADVIRALPEDKRRVTNGDRTWAFIPVCRDNDEELTFGIWIEHY